MARVRGLDHFTAYFAGLEDHYVIIGGSAADVLMEEIEVKFRATKDVDLVILADPSDEVAQRLLAYVSLGEYEIKEATQDQPRYYRFREPKSEDFPEQIEVFSRNAKGLALKDEQHIIPVDTGSADRLSAILLDDAYFGIIQANLYKSEQGHHIIKAVANICLKARAFCELSAKKARGEQGHTDHIKKHRNDILKLATALEDSDRLPLTDRPKRDLEQALQAIEGLDPPNAKDILKDSPIKDPQMLLARIRKTFL
jgi:hypothetical protein